MKNLGLVGIAFVGLAFTACSNDNEGDGGLGETTRPLVIATRQISYEGAGQELAGENSITDMKACVFEKGIMTKVLKTYSQQLMATTCRWIVTTVLSIWWQMLMACWI